MGIFGDVFRLYRMRRNAASSERARQRTIREIRTEANGLRWLLLTPLQLTGRGILWVTRWAIGLRPPGPSKASTGTRRPPNASVSGRIRRPT